MPQIVQEPEPVARIAIDCHGRSKDVSSVWLFVFRSFRKLNVEVLSYAWPHCFVVEIEELPSVTSNDNIVKRWRFPPKTCAAAFIFYADRCETIFGNGMIQYRSRSQQSIPTIVGNKVAELSVRLQRPVLSIIGRNVRLVIQSRKLKPPQHIIGSP